MQQARVRLAGTSPDDLDTICDDVRDIAEKTGVALSGPVP
ncbi:MAG: 30S ribosomal protein S10, partial [Haloarculaceae archaeon]